MGRYKNMGKQSRIRKMIKSTNMSPHYLASCYGKIKFNTYAEAEEAASRINNAEAYKCKYGAHYHRGRIYNVAD